MNEITKTWGNRDDVRELDNRLQATLPGGQKLATNERIALAQAALAHKLDPLNGEIWMIPGRGLMVGIKGLRKKAHEQVKGNYWVDFRQIVNIEERQALGIPDAALAFEARLYDTENIMTYSAAFEKMKQLPWDVIKSIIGDKPYTVGLGVLKHEEQTKMQRAQCAMKRAEADAIKRRFDVPFGVDVEDDVIDAPAPTPPTMDDTARKESREYLYGSDEEGDSLH